MNSIAFKLIVTAPL